MTFDGWYAATWGSHPWNPALLDTEDMRESLRECWAAAVAAERERCGKLAEEGCEREGRYGQGQSDWVARRIRDGGAG